jgi:acyl carrier protein
MVMRVDGRQAIASDVRSIIVTNFLPGESEENLRDDDLLLEGGVIDSGSVITLVGYLEHRFDIQVRDEDLVPENLATIDNIVDFIARKTLG